MEKPFSSTKKEPVNDNGAFNQVGPPSAFAKAPSSSNRPKLCCDVLINHRGPDVKHRVAKAIHDKLYRIGLQIFLDEKQGIPYQPKYRRQWMMLLLYEIKIDDWGWVLEGLAYRVVMAIKGLSRCDTKKLLGQLCSKGRDYWESQLNEISRVLPKGILRSLKISYDALDLEEQELFLDIACFFIAEIKSLVFNRGKEEGCIVGRRFRISVLWSLTRRIESECMITFAIWEEKLQTKSYPILSGLMTRLISFTHKPRKEYRFEG